ncbi:RidA family protein [Vagococcus vulneris]|uniref:Reactive intermediate/imine deaminase n=1 Tax=Vagococcus vulneris TaxID=1977869 RepID=A0A429ZX78_9ENTE|nr:Rid family detoxifying hydrolase [Vagococcus vulneris]RST98447.1 reactive intermediate/imine deaminase [Vagococcus vulneris]
MSRKIISAEQISSSGPYSHAVDAGDYIFLSGQTARNSKEYIEQSNSVSEQTKQVFMNLKQVLTQADLSFENVVKVNVFLTSMEHFDEMNEIYKKTFSKPYPARTCVAVQALPLGADVEIECIAKRG